jgi:hypothetical protein
MTIAGKQQTTPQPGVQELPTFVIFVYYDEKGHDSGKRGALEAFCPHGADRPATEGFFSNLF